MERASTLHFFSLPVFFLPPPNLSTLKMAAEQTYIMIKPDGVQRGLVGQIIAR
jgi:hypothetical protein